MSNVGNKALKAGAWYTICTFVLKGISFITMPIFTRLMETSDIGTYANLTSWVSILSGIITLDLFTSVNLAYFEFKDKIKEYMSTIAIAGTAYTLLIYAAALFFKQEIIDLLSINDYMFHVMLIYFLVNPAISILHAKFRIYLQYKQTIITSLVPTVLSVITSLSMVLIYKNHQLEARVYGYYGVWVVCALVIYIYILISGKSFDLRYLKFALPISVPLIIHTLANTILSTSDRIMINKICGSEDTALYSVAYSCAMIVSILWTAINQAWAPWCFEMMHQNREGEIGKLAKPIIILFSAVVIGVILIAPELLLIMGGHKYTEAVDVIPPIILGLVAQMLYTLYVNIEIYNKKQKQIMTGTVIAAIVNIILNAIFIPLFGYVAAAYTTLAGYILLFIIHYLFVKRMGKEKIYNTKFNVCILSAAMIIGILVTLLYRVFLLRWLTIGIILLLTVFFFIRNRKEILNAIKKRDVLSLFTTLHLM